MSKKYCHAVTSRSEGYAHSARTRSGRALCAYLFVSELRFSRTCGSILSRLRKIFISLSINNLQKVI